MVAQFLVWLMPPDHVALISDTGEPSLGTLHLLLSTLCVLLSLYPAVIVFF